MQTIEETQQETGIRSRRSALVMSGAALAGLALARRAEAQAALTDNDILNFALNLEYLEANYYSLAVNGTPLGAADISGITSLPGATPAVTGAGGTVTVKANPRVNFTTAQLAAYAAETANDELNHVRFLRTALGTNAVAQPNIDLQASFNALASAAGLGAAFDPFANETNFLIGSFIFEDVGVTAYLGAVPLIQSSSTLAAALGIHAVEAYHAGSVRTQIFRVGAPATTISQAVAALRQQLGTVYDTGVNTTQISIGTASTIVDVDPTIARVQPRTPAQVLAIVYGGGAAGTGGAFFPNGVNASNAALR